MTVFELIQELAQYDPADTVEVVLPGDNRVDIKAATRTRYSNLVEIDITADSGDMKSWYSEEEN